MKTRTRLLLTLAGFTLLATLALDLTASVLIRRAVRDRALDRLEAESRYLAARLEAAWPGPAHADAWADEAGSALGVRVTLIDASGRVTGDSEVSYADLPSLENQVSRPEIAAAAARGAGAAARRDVGAALERHFLARRVGPASAPRGFVRLALPDEALRSASPSYRGTLSFVSIGSFALLSAIAYGTIRRLSAPLERVSRAADAVASGRYEAVIEEDSDDEVGHLATSVERMRHSLIEQIARTDSERRLLASILGGLREGILAVNPQRQVLLVNASFRRIFNVPEAVQDGAPVFHVTWDRAVLDAYDEALSRDQAVSRRIAGPAGRSFELTVVPFLDASGLHAGAIGLFFEVTRLEMLERIRRDFIADISHELRTPLASLKASAETLQAGALDERGESERFVQIIARNASRMEAILDDLTDLSLIETGAIHLTLEPVDLAAASREAAAAVAPRASSRGVTIEVEVPAALTIRADRRRLDQVLVNLLDNAVKFNRPAGTVRVTGRREAQAVVLQIEDSGPGIPAEALERVFNRFYRVDRARSQDVPGTGLGLAIVKHLMRLHDGEVRAENRSEGGSRFILTFPSP